MPTGYIYFVKAETGQVKIGWSLTPWERLSRLQIGCPVDLTIVGLMVADPADERRLHAKFAELRCRGEWFNSSPELDEEIARWPAPPYGKLPTLPEPWASAHQIALNMHVRDWQVEAILDAGLVKEEIRDGQRGALVKEWEADLSMVLRNVPLSHAQHERMKAARMAGKEVDVAWRYKERQREAPAPIRPEEPQCPPP